MQSSKKSPNHSSSVGSFAANSRNPRTTNKKHRRQSPRSSEYKYLGRLVTYEQPVLRKSNSLHKTPVFSLNTNHYHHSTEPVYEDDSTSADEDEYGLIKRLGVIKINDRHIREVYRIPTPPPQIKTVVHRLPSPKPKIIERVFVRRPSPEIIENIIQIPPEKVRIINREKYLNKSKPIIRTKLVHLKPHYHYQTEEQQQTTILPTPLQANPHPVSYTQSGIPPHNMFQTQQFSNPQTVQATCYTYNHHQQY